MCHRRTVVVAFSFFAAAHPSVWAQILQEPGSLARCAEAVDASAQAYGRLDKARVIPYMERAYEVCVKQEGPNHPNTLASMHNLAYVNFELGRYREALELDEKTLARRRQILGPDHPDTRATWLNLGNVLSALGRHEEALRVRQELAAVTRAKSGPDDASTLDAMANVANSYFDLKRFDDAAKLNEGVLGARRARFGSSHAATMSSLQNLANTYAALDRNADAATLRAELTLLKQAAQKSDIEAVAEKNKSAVAEAERGNHGSALTLYDQAWMLAREKLGAEHQTTLTVMANAAIALDALGRDAEAIKVREEVLASRKKILGPDHPYTMAIQEQLAWNYRRIDRNRDALKLDEELVQLSRKSPGPDHPDTLRRMRTMAVSYMATGRAADALKLNEEVLTIRREKFGAEDSETLGIMNNLGLGYLSLGRFSESAKLLEEVLTVRRMNAGPNDPFTVATAKNLHIVYLSLQRVADAEKLLQEYPAIKVPPDLQGRPAAVTAIYEKAKALEGSGRFVEIVKLHEEAVSLLRSSLGEDHAETIGGLQWLAEKLGEAGRHSEAVQRAEQVVAMRGAKFQPDDISSILATSNLASYYGRAGRYNDSARTAEELMKSLRSFNLQDNPLLNRIRFSTMTTLAITYGSLGRYGDAIKLHEETYEFAKAKLGADNLKTRTSLINLSNIYEKLGRRGEALKLREEVFYYLQKKYDAADENVLDAAQALSISYFGLGRTKEAATLMEEVVSRSVGKWGASHPETLDAKATLASIFAALGRHVDASRLNEENLAISRANLGSDHPRTIRRMESLAANYTNLRRDTAAMNLAVEALTLNRSIYGVEHLNTLSNLSHVAYCYYTLGRLSDIVSLASEYKSGAEKYRGQAGLSIADRQAIFVAVAEGYRQFSRYLGELGRKERRPEYLAQAFELAELSKARTLLETMAAASAARTAGLSATESEALEQLNKEIASLDEAIAKEGTTSFNPQTLRELQTRKRTAAERLQAMQERLQAGNPKYAKLLHVRNARAGDAGKLLEADQVVISFVLENRGNLSAWMLDASGNPRYFELGLRNQLRANIARLRALLSGEITARDTGEEARLRQQLFDILFNRLRTDLAVDIEKKKRWIIIPDGDLALLPFDALLSPASNGKRELLVERHDISVVQSWSVYALLKEREDEYRQLRRGKALFAMGNAVYDAATHQSAAAISRTASRVAMRGWNGESYLADIRAPDARAERDVMQNLRWGNLPGTALEVETVSRIFQADADKFVDGAASEATLQSLNKAGKLADYRYLLFSAHGYLASNPALTSLVLSLHDRTPDADGYITASEWPSYNFKSDLMVLSACDTGVGNTLPGEGVMGLPYALFVAGNRNTLLTLWPVADEATAEFMRRFFTRLKNGEAQVSALTAVKREFAADPTYGHPRFWAAFVLYGV